MTFYIEYQVSPSKDIKLEKIHTETKEKAIELFRLTHPNAIIREVEGYHQHNL